MKTMIALAAAFAATAAASAPPEHPKLVVAISVDQFSADLFAEYRSSYVAGLRRLADAVVFPSGYQSHGATETCPGHSTILTGSHPARTGIIANDWIDMSVARGTNGSHRVYCAEDETKPGTSFTDYYVSPIHLRVPTMGDRMKLADPRSRVVSVAGKDRAAVMMGGHRTDAIWYLDPKGLRSYVTLPDRHVPVPEAVRRVNARIAGQIDHPAQPELPALCRTRSVPVRTEPDGPEVGVLQVPHDFRTTPAFDEATADVAIGLIREMHLGHGAATDIIDIGLSTNDYVGHAFGTEGAEMCAQQVALDRTVGRILSALDANGAPYVVVLTADHGGFDIPERHDLRGAPDAARLDAAVDMKSISKSLITEFRLDVGPGELWLGDLPGDIYLNAKVPAALRPELVAATRARLLAFPQVEAAYTPDEIERVAPPRPPVDDWSLAQRLRASFDRSRSGDLVVVLRPRVIGIVHPRVGYTATHGSPWNYDRRVPILFWYPGAVPHEQPLSIETVDILPTLAALVGLEVPSREIDGRCVDLDPGKNDTCR